MSENNGGKEPNKNNDNNNAPNGPSIQNKLIWLIIIFVPIALIMFGNTSSTSDDSILSQSKLTELVKDDKVDSVQFLPEKGILNYMIARVKLKGDHGVDSEKIKPYNKEESQYDVINIDFVGLKNLLETHQITYTVIKPREETMKEIVSMLLPLLLIVFIIYFLFSRQLRNAGKGAMQFGKSKAKLMSPSNEKVTFADVAGIEEARSEVEEIVDFLKDPDKYRILGGRLPKGCLMVGPPGTGKTLLARAIAGEAEVPFYSMSGSDFVEMFVGVGASRVRDMFDQAKKNQPCILFIDEIDAVGRARNASVGGGGGHDEREQTLNALLVEMDGFENQHGVIILAATNRPDILDPALLRPGRFDRRIVVDLPDLEGRLQILKVHARKVKMASSVELSSVAKGTAGFSGADLANLINEAALLAAGQNKKAVGLEDLEEARDKVRWGKERKSRKMSEKEQRLTAYHEAGHTLVGLHCKNSTPLHKVTIMPRGSAYLGATMYLPESDSYTQSRSELLDGICVSVGGRLAEEIEFGEITNGAASDIKHATDVARKMVRDWGMSDEMGFLKYSHDEKEGGYHFQNEYSEKIGNKIDDEVRKMIDFQFERAKSILIEHRDQLTLLSETLLKKETMSAYEVKTLLGFEVSSDDQDIKNSTTTDRDDSDKEDSESDSSDSKEQSSDKEGSTVESTTTDSSDSDKEGSKVDENNPKPEVSETAESQEKEKEADKDK